MSNSGLQVVFLAQEVDWVCAQALDPIATQFDRGIGTNLYVLCST